MVLHSLRDTAARLTDDERYGRDGWMAPARAPTGVLDLSLVGGLSPLEAADQAQARLVSRRQGVDRPAVDGGFAGPEIG